MARSMSDVADVTVFEKSRSPGGRIATRYAGDFEFDHGAQFFTARTTAFRDFLQPLLDDGVIANWPAELDVRFETAVGRLERSNDRWTLLDAANKNLGQFDWLVLTAPAPQTAALVEELPEIVSLCRGREMRGRIEAAYTSANDLVRHLRDARVVRSSPKVESGHAMRQALQTRSQQQEHTVRTLERPENGWELRDQAQRPQYGNRTPHRSERGGAGDDVATLLAGMKATQ